MEVTIRPLREEDARTSVKWRNDSEVFKYTGGVYDHEITLEMELAWIRKVMANKDEYRCAILVDGVYVGNIYLTDISKESAQYHIFIGDRTYWGKGIAKKASRIILRHAFNSLTLDWVYLRVQRQNKAALQLYRGLGFSVYGEDERWISMKLDSAVFEGRDSEK